MSWNDLNHYSGLLIIMHSLRRISDDVIGTLTLSLRDMYVCMYTWYMCVIMQACVYVCMYICVYVCMYVCTYILYVCTYVYVYVYV